MKPVSIISFASISPLGSTTQKVWKSYLEQQKHYTKVVVENDVPTVVGALGEEDFEKLANLREEVSHYKNLDKTVLMALYAARNAVKEAGWQKGDNFGINMGSSRGATELLENYHKEFLNTGSTPTLTSPTTTLGNVATWIANDLLSKGPAISHSITCSTALHALLNGIAWLQSGLTDKFLIGGSEAPLTAFTIAQMRALKIYSQFHTEEYPCRALDFSKKRDQMFLGEGAAVFCLEEGVKPNAMGIIKGIGYATEKLTHNISISENANCFQESMKMALKEIDINTIDAIVMHAPGTIKGDTSEYNAIKSVFGSELPFLTCNKWKIGHSFGASGGLSLELALLMLQNQKCIDIPYLKKQNTPKEIKNILVNAVGFGGNAVSVLVSK